MSLKFCSLASGSSGNCQYIASDETGLLLDAGLSGKYIKNALEQIDESFEFIKGILITHEHSDHIKGVGVLMRRYDLDVYVTEKTWEAMSEKIGKIKEEKVKIIKNDEAFHIGDIEVHPYPIAHDASDPVCYAFSRNDAKICIATDLGHASNDMIEHIKDCDLLMLESNHDVNMLMSGKYPYYLKKRVASNVGHLSNETAAELAMEVIRHGRANHILLAHLSKENNFPELAMETVKTHLEGENVKIGTDIQVDMTYRDRVSKLYWIK